MISFYCYVVIREGKFDKEAYALEAYQRQALIILEKYKNETPIGLTKGIIMMKSYNKEKRSPSVTGKIIWETMWEPLSIYVKNVMLVTWIEVRPTTKSSKIKSGVENFEPALLKFRKKLWDLDKNSIPIIIEAGNNATHKDRQMSLSHTLI
jgi:hypothetical protein